MCSFMARSIFDIDLDAFSFSVEQVLNPQLKGKLVIADRDTERRGAVTCVSYEAAYRHPGDSRAPYYVYYEHKTEDGGGDITNKCEQGDITHKGGHPGQYKHRG